MLGRDFPGSAVEAGMEEKEWGCLGVGWGVVWASALPSWVKVVDGRALLGVVGPGGGGGGK